MRIVRVRETVPVNRQTFRLHHLTDLHVGAPDFDEAAFLERRKLIEDDPWARWTFGGDGGDLIRHNDRRYSPTELAAKYRQATDLRYATLEHLQELFDPIKDKLWGACDGNHESKVDEHNGGKFGAELAVNLGVESKWVDYWGFVHVTFQRANSQRRLSQLIDLHHGWQSGRSRGAFANQAEKELSMSDADVVLRGHSHKPGHAVLKTLGVDGNVTRARFRFRTVVNGGTWRRGYRDDLPPVDRNRLSEVEGSMWSERKGFRLEHVGGPVILLHVGFGNVKNGRGSGLGKPAFVEHSVVDGLIDAESLRLD